MPIKLAHTSTDVLSIIEQRWSPRAYDAAHTLTAEQLQPAFEAARWAPSASNTQPWRFILTLRGSETFDRVLENLAPMNAHWAERASALVVNITEFERDGEALRWSEYDLGQAVSYFTVQAVSEGLCVHQMGGFDAVGLSDAFALSASERPVSVMAVGVPGTTDHLSERQLEQELGARTRKDLAETVSVL